MITYAFNNFKLERDAWVERIGYKGEGRLVAWKVNPDTQLLESFVVTWKGYGENPGSRYSMLYSYYPATTEVFVFDHEQTTRDGSKRNRYRHLIEWQTRPSKKKGDSK